MTPSVFRSLLLPGLREYESKSTTPVELDISMDLRDSSLWIAGINLTTRRVERERLATKDELANDMVEPLKGKIIAVLQKLDAWPAD